MSTPPTTTASSSPSLPPPPSTADEFLHLAGHDLASAAAHLPSLPPSLLLSLLSSLPTSLLSLLPRILSLLCGHPQAPTTAALDSLLAAPWPTSTFFKFAAILRDFPSQFHPQVPEFLAKLFVSMPSADVQDLPSLAYQLLLLASKGICTKMVLHGLLRFFGNGRVKAAPFIVRQVEGTVLMHVEFAVKQDPALAKEIVTIIKADLGQVSHFAVAVLLSVVTVKQFTENALGEGDYTT